jgi:hypothetical protein
VVFQFKLEGGNEIHRLHLKLNGASKSTFGTKYSILDFGNLKEYINKD